MFVRALDGSEPIGQIRRRDLCAGRAQRLAHDLRDRHSPLASESLELAQLGVIQQDLESLCHDVRMSDSVV